MLLQALLCLVLIASAFAAPAPQGIVISDSIQQKPITICGAAQNVVLTDTPWIVYNMFYNQAQTKGSMCTGYNSVTTGSHGNKQIHWSAITTIEYIRNTYVAKFPHQRLMPVLI